MYDIYVYIYIIYTHKHTYTSTFSRKKHTTKNFGIGGSSRANDFGLTLGT